MRVRGSLGLLLLLLGWCFAGQAQWAGVASVAAQDASPARVRDAGSDRGETARQDGSPARPLFENASKMEGQKFAGEATIQRINDAIPEEYHLGPGDVVDVQVWDQPTLSGRHTIGPDGTLAIPLIGELDVEGMTRTEAMSLIRTSLETFYQDPFVNLQILEYKNNRVFVLGRVTRPGMVSFDGRGTLLEALAMAGSVPVLDRTTQLTKCAVIRGRQQIIWIDLKELLVYGNMNLNLRLANNDVVYIPDGHDALVYVMGEVETPGAYRITPEMSFLDALMLAGGPTLDAKKGKLALIRNEHGVGNVREITLAGFRKGDFAGNILLEENDIIFVYRKGIAKLHYFLTQISPFAQWLLVDQVVSD